MKIEKSQWARVHPIKSAASNAIEVKDFHVWFRENHILKGIHTKFEQNTVTSIIGPSGAGKSTLIRSINRINDEVAGFSCSGEIFFQNKNIYSDSTDVHDIRQQIGMIFQKPCVFPKSIYKNVIFGAKHVMDLNANILDEIVEENLQAVSLWDEVKDRLHESAVNLSLGQQQRLCLARALAVKPKMILMDEPTSALDPVATLAIEDLISQLKSVYTIAVVTHNIEQAKRISDAVIFMCEGQVVEQGTRQEIFARPQRKQTQDYISWNKCDC